MAVKLNRLGVCFTGTLVLMDNEEFDTRPVSAMSAWGTWQVDSD